MRYLNASLLNRQSRLNALRDLGTGTGPFAASAPPASWSSVVKSVGSGGKDGRSR